MNSLQRASAAIVGVAESDLGHVADGLSPIDLMAQGIHRAREIPAYCQSQPHTALAIGEALLQLKERLEDGFVLLGGDPDTRVAYS